MLEATKVLGTKSPPLSRVRDMKMLIVKLRWIGLENEAAQLQGRLRTIAPEECAGLWTHETD